MTSPLPTPAEQDRLDRARSKIELVGAVAVTATQVLAAFSAIASIVRRRTACR